MKFSIGNFTVRVFFAWYDLWIGAFIDTYHNIIYVCPLPTLVFSFRKRLRTKKMEIMPVDDYDDVPF
jgi:hypothetical protein